MVSCSFCSLQWPLPPRGSPQPIFPRGSLFKPAWGGHSPQFSRNLTLRFFFKTVSLRYNLRTVKYTIRRLVAYSQFRNHRQNLTSVHFHRPPKKPGARQLVRSPAAPRPAPGDRRPAFSSLGFPFLGLARKRGPRYAASATAALIQRGGSEFTHAAPWAGASFLSADEHCPLGECDAFRLARPPSADRHGSVGPV